ESEVEIGEPEVVRRGRGERLDLAPHLVAEIAHQRGRRSGAAPGREGGVQQVESRGGEGGAAAGAVHGRSPLADGERRQRLGVETVAARLPAAVEPGEPRLPEEL